MGLFRSLRKALSGASSEAIDSRSIMVSRPGVPMPAPAVPPPPAPPPMPSASEIAEKIAALMELETEPALVAETYAAFERNYPKASLRGPAQLKVAMLLEQAGRRLLAIEAYRKAMAAPDTSGVMAHEARLALVRLLSRSTATYSDALRLADLVQKQDGDPARREEVQRIAQRIRTEWDAIFPLDASGRETARPDGPCSILSETASKISIPIAADILMRHLDLPSLDTRVALAREPGILARNLNPCKAEAIARDIQAADIPVVVLAEANCPELPMAQTVTGIQIRKSGEFAFRLPQGEEIIHPHRIRHAHMGYIPLDMNAANRSRTYYNAIAGTSRLTVQSERDYSGMMNSSAHNNLHGLCDFYAFDPFRRYRLSVGRTPVQDVIQPVPSMPSPTFEAMLKRLLGFCSSLALNYTLDMLFSDAPPARITYKDMKSFENHALWFFWLACNGAPSE